MPNKAEKNYSSWLKKAEEDELNASSILKHRDGTPSGVCFLSQQMAEKYLKGLLVFHEKNFPKVHDLLQLESLLTGILYDIKEVHEAIVHLNRYYIETRYPGDYPEFSWEDAEEAFEAATRIKDFVMERISHA